MDGPDCRSRGLKTSPTSGFDLQNPTTSPTSWTCASRFRPQAFNRETVRLFTPGYWLIPFFLPVFLLYAYYDYLSPFLVLWFGEEFGWGRERFIKPKAQEPAEFLLALGFLCFVAVNRYHLSTAVASRAPTPHPREPVELEGRLAPLSPESTSTPNAPEPTPAHTNAARK